MCVSFRKNIIHKTEYLNFECERNSAIRITDRIHLFLTNSISENKFDFKEGADNNSFQ